LPSSGGVDGPRVVSWLLVGKASNVDGSGCWCNVNNCFSDSPCSLFFCSLRRKWQLGDVDGFKFDAFHCELFKLVHAIEASKFVVACNCSSFSSLTPFAMGTLHFATIFVAWILAAQKSPRSFRVSSLMSSRSSFFSSAVSAGDLSWDKFQRRSHRSHHLQHPGCQ
jgi:hypothetical protein